MARMLAMIVLSSDLSVVGGTLQKIVDLVAEDMPALLKQLDGRTIPFPSGPTVLHTARAMREFPMRLRLELQRTLNDSKIASLLMAIGTIGMTAEL